MKKFWKFCLLAALTLSSHSAFAQKELGTFNTFAVGVSGGTTGIGIDLAAPLNPYFSVRGGLHIIPDISIEDNMDVDVSENGYTRSYSASVKGGIGRTTGELILNIHPFKSSFFIAAGASFGGSKVVKIDGYSDELKDLMQTAEQAGLVIGDYTIPVDRNGRVSGGLETKSVRPYLGLGFGRPVPKKRIGVLFDMGVQFGKMKVYAENGDLGQALESADDDISDNLDKLTVSPVIRLRLCGRIL